MLSLTIPWWELVLRATVVYACLLLLVRLSGKRTVGQFTPFDLVVVVLLSESVSNGLTGGDQSLVAGLISATTLIALNFSMAWLTSRSKQVEQVVEGREVVLGRNGKTYPDVFRRERVSDADFKEALREHDCSLDEMRCALLEVDGKISILKR